MALTVPGQRQGDVPPSPSLATRRWLARIYLARLRPSRRADSEKSIAEYRQRHEKDKRTKQDFTFWANKEIADHVGKLKEADLDNLKESDYILFQVIAKDGFTGFTRLQTKRFYKRDLGKKIAPAAASADAPSTPAQPPSLTTR
jgi:hypothetical protein